MPPARARLLTFASAVALLLVAYVVLSRWPRGKSAAPPSAPAHPDTPPALSRAELRASLVAYVDAEKRQLIVARPRALDSAVQHGSWPSLRWRSGATQATLDHPVLGSLTLQVIVRPLAILPGGEAGPAEDLPGLEPRLNEMRYLEKTRRRHQQAQRFGICWAAGTVPHVPFGGLEEPAPDPNVRGRRLVVREYTYLDQPGDTDGPEMFTEVARWYDYGSANCSSGYAGNHTVDRVWALSFKAWPNP